VYRLRRRELAQQVVQPPAAETTLAVSNDTNAKRLERPKQPVQTKSCFELDGGTLDSEALARAIEASFRAPWLE